MAIVLGAALLAALPACGGLRRAERPAPSGTTVTSVEERGGAVRESMATTVTARVEAIDHRTRMATLRLPDGERVTFRVDERVRNLDQVRKGDDVRVTLYESLMLAIRKPGETMPGVQTASGTARARPGQKPEAVQARQVRVTAKVTAVDRERAMVSLEGIDGRKVRVRARDPKRLEHVQVGDLVEAIYTEAVAVAVEKPGR